MAVEGIVVLFLAASIAPSPLYVVYQQQWGFTAWVLTVVVAVYVIGLLGSLLVVGALSDHVGRRPVLAAAIGLEAVALVLLLVAGNVVALSVARLLQGIATGAAMTTFGATLVDLEPAHARGRPGVVNSVAPTAGLALGALGCGALVEFGPAPTRLVYALLIRGMLLAAAYLLRSRPAPSLLAPASVLLVLGTLASLAGISTDLIALAALGTVIAGIGFGAAALATFGTFARIAAPHERSALFAAAFVISYVARWVPAPRSAPSDLATQQ